MTILINISQQKLSFKEKHYPISTALKGTGQEEGSFKTPLGKHSIVEKIGEGLDSYTVFVSRQATQERAKKGETKPRVIGRILRLQGLEEGYNKGYNEKGLCVDSYQRYIYIHATTRKVGQPSSLGCICLSPEDMVELFDLVSVGDLVLIFVDNPK